LSGGFFSGARGDFSNERFFMGEIYGDTISIGTLGGISRKIFHGGNISGTF